MEKKEENMRKMRDNQRSKVLEKVDMQLFLIISYSICEMLSIVLDRHIIRIQISPFIINIIIITDFEILADAASTVTIVPHV